MVPTDGDGGAAKVLLEFVVEGEVADGVAEEVHLVHDFCGILPYPLQLFRRVSHFTAERVWMRDFLKDHIWQFSCEISKKMEFKDSVKF